MNKPKGILLENVRLSAELSGIYNRLLQVIYLADKCSESETMTDLVNIADSIRETIAELPLCMEGEINNDEDKD